MVAMVSTSQADRAAAFSAARAGYDPYWIDQFGDQDLVAAFPGAAVAAEDYPHGIIEKLDEVPAMPWLYTGAMENHLHLFDRISKTHSLLGNDKQICQNVRDPEQLGNCWKDAGIICPEVSTSVENVSTGKSYLLKPVRSGGGLGIKVYDCTEPVPSGHYLQEMVEGENQSAVFLGNSKSAFLAGVTRQLIGVTSLNAAPFAYCGSVGPLQPDANETAQWRKIGNALVEKFGLIGLFGVDAVNRAGNVIPIEVNPRYTASVEVIEQATAIPLIKSHEAACRGQLPERISMPGAIIGKAILFAPCNFEVTTDLSDANGSIAGNSIRLADIPREGTVIESSHPVLTVLVSGENCDACLQNLMDITSKVSDLLLSPQNRNHITLAM